MPNVNEPLRVFAVMELHDGDTDGKCLYVTTSAGHADSFCKGYAASIQDMALNPYHKWVADELGVTLWVAEYDLDKGQLVKPVQETN